MKKRYKWMLILPMLLCSYAVAAQEATSDEIIEYASPGVEGMGRSRGIVVSYERLPQFDVSSFSTDPSIGSGFGRVRRNNMFEVRAFAPLMNRPRTKLIFGFSYFFEDYHFTDVSPAAYDLYDNLEAKNLKSLGAQLAYLRSVDAERFYLLRLKGELNGDYNVDNINLIDYLKTTVDVLYGWKKSPYLSYGIGVQLGYTFGRKRIYPAVLYNRTFNKNWGVESIFPANFRIRYNISPGTLLYVGYKLDGASYNLFSRNPPLSDYNQIELRRTGIKGLVRLEREIYDFLWFAVEGGFRENVRFRVFDEVNSSRPPLIQNNLAGAGFISAELYVVPPRRFSERNR